jgi:hypothetical protein
MRQLYSRIILLQALQGGEMRAFQLMRGWSRAYRHIRKHFLHVVWDNKFINVPVLFTDLGWLSRYSDWLQAGRPRGPSSNPNKAKNFLFTSCIPAPEPTELLIHLLAGVKLPGREANRPPPSSAVVKTMWVYTPPYVFMAQKLFS